MYTLSSFLSIFLSPSCLLLSLAYDDDDDNDDDTTSLGLLMSQ